MPELTLDTCRANLNKATIKKERIWALFLLNLPLAFAIINSVLSYKTSELYTYFNVTTIAHEILVFIILLIPLCLLLRSLYHYNYIGKELIYNSGRINSVGFTGFEEITSSLDRLEKRAKKAIRLNIISMVIYILFYFTMFIFKT